MGGSSSPVSASIVLPMQLWDCIKKIVEFRRYTAGIILAMECHSRFANLAAETQSCEWS
jgi:hypothetical protein